MITKLLCEGRLGISQAEGPKTKEERSRQMECHMQRSQDKGETVHARNQKEWFISSLKSGGKVARLSRNQSVRLLSHVKNLDFILRVTGSYWKVTYVVILDLYLRKITWTSLWRMQEFPAICTIISRAHSASIRNEETQIHLYRNPSLSKLLLVTVPNRFR